MRRLALELAAVARLCLTLGLEVPAFVGERLQGPDPAEVDVERRLRREEDWVSRSITGAQKLRQIAAVEIDRLLERRAALLSS